MRTAATWADGALSVDLPGGPVSGVPRPTGETRTVDYWGRREVVEIVEGPWAEAFGRHLGRDVLLARARPGAVVYGAPVSVVTSGSLALLAQRLGGPVAGARFRATLEVWTGDTPMRLEDDWVGRTLRVGSALLRVREPVPRCAVVDLDPRSGVRDADVLRLLAGYRRGHEGVTFGVDAEVVTPGRVRSGDPVELGRD